MRIRPNLIRRDDVLSFVVLNGFHARLGARPMRDAVEKFVGDAVTSAAWQTKQEKNVSPSTAESFSLGLIPRSLLRLLR